LPSRRCVLPLLCDPDADDEAVIVGVLDHYQDERRHSEQAKNWLAVRGVDDALADELRIGFANRTLGYRLPEANRKDGAKLRDQLMRLGIYRSSGHEHFRGCMVVPVLSADGRVFQLCGIRLASASSECQWAAGLPGGMLNEAVAANAEVIVVASVDEALSVIGAGHRAVVAPGRPGGFHTADLRLLTRGGVQRATIVGDGLGKLAGRIGAEGIECELVSPGASLTALLGRAVGDRTAALAALLATAIPHRVTDNATATATASVEAPALPVDGSAMCPHVSHERVLEVDRFLQQNGGTG
jgi:hypothetical protein